MISTATFVTEGIGILIGNGRLSNRCGKRVDNGYK